jgi:hypothetical protein
VVIESVDWEPILSLVVGLAMGARYVWLFLGRTRAARSWAWRHTYLPWTESFNSPRGVLVVRPLFALFCLLLPALVFTSGTDAVAVVLGLLFLPCMVLCLAYMILPLPVPKFVQPQWYRRYREYQG